MKKLIVVLSLAAALLAAGCTSTPEPRPAETPTGLGRVGVLAVPSTPRAGFHAFAEGWAEGVAQRGGLGMVNNLMGALSGMSRNPPSGPYGSVSVLIALTVETGVSTAVYRAAGVSEAVPASIVGQIEKDLDRALGGVRLSDDLAEKIAAAAVARPEIEPSAVIRLEPSGEAPASGEPPGQAVDTIVEVQVTEAGFRGDGDAQPDVSFYVNARIGLWDMKTGEQLYTRDFQYLSPARPFAAWFVNGSRDLMTGFSQAMNGLAGRVVDELFTVTEFPFAAAPSVIAGTKEFGSCWFDPVYPEVEYTATSDPDRAPGVHIRYNRVDSLAPLLMWEEFPRPRDLAIANAEVLNQITDVRYDLKIWEGTGDYPLRLVYDITGLHEPQYRPAFPLQPQTKYFWTFRARYNLAGQPRATRWAFSSVPVTVSSGYVQLPPDEACAMDAIPDANYFRFTTPAY